MDTFIKKPFLSTKMNDGILYLDLLKAMGLPLDVEDQIKAIPKEESRIDHIQQWIIHNKDKIVDLNKVPDANWEEFVIEKFGVTMEMCNEAKQKSSNCNECIADVLVQRAQQLLHAEPALPEDRKLEISDDEDEDYYTNSGNDDAPYGDPPSNPARKMSCSQQRYEKPTPSYFKTSAAEEIMKKIKSEHRRTNIVHIYGVGGSGKSEIIRQCCHSFDQKNCVIWQITCNERVPSVEGKLRELAKNISTENLNFHDWDYKSFVQTLYQLQMPVLIAIDNVSPHQQDDSHDVEELIKEIDHFAAKGDRLHTLALLVSSRRQNAIFPNIDDKDAIEIYMQYFLNGFTEQEAKNFLCKNRREGLNEGAEELARLLCYSPLRMIGVKQFCHKQGMSYRQYINEKTQQGKILMEAEEQDFESDFNAEHGYEILIEWLNINYTEEQLTAIPLLSFLNCDEIPLAFLKRIIGYCTSWNDLKTNSLISRLKDDDYFHFRNNFESDFNYVSVHEDMLFAVRNKIPADDKTNVILKLLDCFDKYISKDNRESLTSLQYFQITKHIEIALKHASEYIKYEFDKWTFEQFSLPASIIRLYDIVGMNLTQMKQLSEAESMFHTAIEFLWKLIQSCANVPQKSNSILYAPNQDYKVQAQKIFKVCQFKKFDKDFVDRFTKRTLVLTVRDIEGMKTWATETNGENEFKRIQLERILNVIQRKQPLSDKDFSILQDLGTILPPSKMKKIFFIEKICSVLHSRSRILLYFQNLDESMQKMYRYYAMLCHELAKIARKKLKIAIFAEYISVANNLLPGMFKFLPQEAEKKIPILKEVKCLSIRCLDEIPNEKFYENGCYKHIKGTAYTQINALKYEVRANTKLTKYEAPLEDWETKCNLLLGLANGNPSLLMSSNCRIQCGKYFAAIGKFDKAISAIESGISMEVGGKKYGNHITMAAQPSVFAWSIYNYGRAILAGNLTTDNTLVQKFTNWCEIALNSDCTNEWKTRLTKMKKQFNPSGLNQDSECYFPD